MQDPRYPIGRFERPVAVSVSDRQHNLAAIEQAPALLRASVEALDDAQLDTPYRDGGWTLRQVVHHVADSHANAYVRTKLALTEDTPTIRTYVEKRWAELPEARTSPVEVSLALLDTLHRRWLACLRELPAGAFARQLVHPDSGAMSLDQLLALYAWHGRHHIAHITTLRQARGW
jgi:uncharacterized damage-inducible protein DinB